MKHLRSGFVQGIAMAIVLAAAAYARFVGINWDEYQHLHPDERFLTMVETSIKPVTGGWAEYFDTKTSSLNPYNHGFNFFVYGTAPIFLVRYVAEWFSNNADQIADLGFGFLGALGEGYDQVHIVGRSISAIADVISVATLYFIGRRLYGWRVGLTAAALSAGTVALIQQAHFFTVDSFATLCVTVGLFAAVRVLDYGRLRDYLLFGIAFGLALGSRVNTAPLVLVILIASRLHFVRSACLTAGKSAKVDVYGLAVAGGVAALVFRIVQPYTFNGSGILGVTLNDQWLRNMDEIRGIMQGHVDVPFNHQWTGRIDLLFPWTNMVLWGMGPALGIAGWCGFAWCGLRIVLRKADWSRHAIPVLWTGVYFLWQSTQWVKPIRYFLPIYPTLTLLGAWLVITVGSELAKRYTGRGRQIRRGWGLVRRIAPFGLASLVIAMTAVYAFAFTRIYTRPVTRVAASRWIYQNIAGPFSVAIDKGDGIYTQPIAMPPGHKYRVGEEFQQRFVALQTGVITEIAVGRLKEENVDSEDESFMVEILEHPDRSSILGSGRLDADFGNGSGYTISLDEKVQVVEGQSYYLVSSVLDGGDVFIEGAHLINESTWDDGLPLRIDGYDPYGGIYTGHNLELYWEDDESKRDRLLQILDDGDYILISSNRQYGSIPRLPMRYPMTVAYYEMLFSGELGFELAKEFESAPNIGGWVVSDQTAEEPFTVYDHPKVFIFRKSAEFSIERVRSQLKAIDLSKVIWMNPREATSAPWALTLTPARLAEQRAGGTWSSMFDYKSPQNQYHILGVVTWWGLLMLVGSIQFPLTFVALRGLADKGYAVTKVLGLVMLSYGGWILASARLVGFTRWAIWGVLAALAVLSVWVYSRYRREMGLWMRANVRYMLTVEILWLGLFSCALLVRWNNPDLWHPVYGGEKPMDFAYFNAVLRSTSFPPYDPWFSGGYINYYYYGFVIVGVLTKMLGIVPAVAYNIILPMLFAMTGTGAFCVAANIVGRTRSRGKVRLGQPMIVAGVMATALMVLLGNLGQLDTIAKSLGGSGTRPLGLAGWPDDVSGAVGDLVERVKGGMGGTQVGTGEWYWNATRIIEHAPGEPGPITEFPLFTFLYGDMHAHMIALPVTLLAMAWALAVVAGAEVRRDTRESVIHWLVGGLIIGALGPTNTWDLPTYLMLACVAIGCAQLIRHSRSPNAVIRATALRLAVLIGASAIMYYPYTFWYASDYNSLTVWNGSRTPITSYLKVHGLFLFLIVSFLVAEMRLRMQRAVPDGIRRRAKWFVVVILMICLAAGLALFFVYDVSVGIIVLPLVGWTAVLALVPQMTWRKRAALVIVAVGLVLTLGVEFWRLDGDVGRMNTVFKVYLQVWTLFSVAGGASFGWIWYQQRSWRRGAAMLWSIGLLALVMVGALYTNLAVAAKIRDRMADGAPRTLDGMAYMKYAEYRDQQTSIDVAADLAAILWLQRNAVGSPVIVEAHTTEYKYGGRYTINTGLPGVIGWSWHQRQQRAVTPAGLVTDRVRDVAEFYRGVDVSGALAFVRKYDVTYVVVSGYERAYYPKEGLDKFGLMVDAEMLDVVYVHDGTTIYEVRSEMKRCAADLEECT